MGNNEYGGNYNVPLNYAKETFRKRDPKLMARLTCSEYDEENSIIKVKYINEIMNVHYPSGEVFYENNKKCRNIELEILLIRFLGNAQTIIPRTKKYVTFKEIEGGHVYYPAFLRTTLSSLANIYGNNIEKFREDLEKLDATPLNMGDASYEIRFMNDTYMVFSIWEGDEEMMPYANILFDLNITHYFNAEDIAVVGSVPFYKMEYYNNKKNL